MVDSNNDSKLEEYILATVDHSIAGTAVPLVHEALRLIAGGLWRTHAQALRLAALRRYLRFQNVEWKNIRESWAWTAREAETRLNEEPARTLIERARTVQRTFAEHNRGYRLELSPLRPLARQVELWNDNSGVRTAAATLKANMLTELASPGYDSPPTSQQVGAFSDVLEVSSIRPEPGNAAPGLSSHGQMRAVDFVVMQGTRSVATTSTWTSQTVWRDLGWADRLANETRAAGFRGPLRTPDEPWHWWLD